MEPTLIFGDVITKYDVIINCTVIKIFCAMYLTNIEPVKRMQQVKIAHSILQSVSNLFHFIILSLPM